MRARRQPAAGRTWVGAPRSLRYASRMAPAAFSMAERKRIALIAHDNRKPDLLDWARYNRGTLSRHHLYATGTTGSWLQSELDLEVQRFLSGPLGGDQQV